MYPRPGVPRVLSGISWHAFLLLLSTRCDHFRPEHFARSDDEGARHAHLAHDNTINTESDPASGLSGSDLLVDIIVRPNTLELDSSMYAFIVVARACRE
jgi:hypothetical protein